MGLYFYLVLMGCMVLVLTSKREWIEIYATSEANLTEAQRIYHCLKAHGIHCTFHVRPGKGHFSFSFQSKENSIVRIQVYKQEEQRARENLLHYRVLSRQKERAYQ